MAIDLLHSFLQKGNQVSSGQNSPASQAAQNQQSSIANQQVLRAVQALKAGQTLQGEIVSVKGDQVQLEVLKEVIIEARLSGALSLTPGSNMTFQVKGNQGGSLSLMPLFTNVSADPNVLKALDMAGLAVNERTTQMVQQMMERGMSINKQSLMEMYREIVSHKSSPVADIVDLKHMNLPITEDNLQQYALYRNNSHFLTETFSDIGKAIGAQLESWMMEGKTDTAANVLLQIRNILNGQGETNVQQALAGDGENAVLVKDGAAAALVADDILMAGKNEETLDVQAKQSMNPEQLLQEAGEGEAAKAGQTDKSAATQGNDSWNQLLNLISGGKASQKLSALFEKLWNQEVGKQWMLEPGDIPEKEKVQELYEKMNRQVKQLEGVLDEHVSQQSAAGKAVHNTSANLDFMHQLNQIHAYVQLPLKMSNQNTNGELYVFTNRKSMAREDGRVTALLHLDMEYLGKMDIFVALEETKVSTQFYLEKEEYLDFIEGHMDLLTSRLQKRGYECSIKTSLRKDEEEDSMIQKMSASNGGQILLSTQAFDMRA